MLSLPPISWDGQVALSFWGQQTADPKGQSSLLVPAFPRSEGLRVP